MNEQPNQTAANAPKKYQRMQQFFHANMKCSGSVLSFRLIPSESNEEGGVMLKLAKQLTPPDNANKKGATFDHKNGIFFKLSLVEIGKLIQVLTGKEKELTTKTFSDQEPKPGLRHKSKILFCEHKTSGHGESYQFTIMEYGPEGTTEKRSITFFASPDEVFVMRTALMSAIGLVFWGTV